MKIGGIELWPIAKATGKRFMAADLQGMAAEVAYHLLFSIVPLLLFLTSLSGFIGRQIGIGNVVSDITAWLRTNSNLPAATIEVVLVPIEQILENQTGGLLSIGAAIALWSGKNAVSSLMKALNGAYNVEETRPWWRTQATAIGLTIALGLAVVGSSIFFVAGSAVGNWIAGWLGIGEAWTTVWGWARFPLIALLLCVAVSFLFWAGPDRDAPYKFISAGAVVTVALWALVTLGLGLYFQYMGGYVTAYGLLGGLLGFVFWLYVMSLILLFGGLLNEVLQRLQVTGTVETNWPPTKRTDQRRERPAGPILGPPVPAISSIRATIRQQAGTVRSAEETARQQEVERRGADRDGRLLTAARMLGAATLAAISAVVLGIRNRP